MQFHCPTSVHIQQPIVEFTLHLLQRASTTYLEGARMLCRKQYKPTPTKEILSQFPQCRYLLKTPNTQEVWYRFQNAYLKVTERSYTK